MIPPRRSDGIPDGLEVHTFCVEGQEYALLSWDGPSPFELRALTQAEREVLLLVLDGLSNEEIGNRRGTRARTVANQLACIYRKLGICSRLELFSMVFR